MFIRSFVFTCMYASLMSSQLMTTFKFLMFFHLNKCSNYYIVRTVKNKAIKFIYIVKETLLLNFVIDKFYLYYFL